MQSRSRAVASNRQNDTIASVIFSFLLFLSHQKHHKFPGRGLHHGHCLSHNSDTTSVICFWLGLCEGSCQLYKFTHHEQLRNRSLKKIQTFEDMMFGLLVQCGYQLTYMYQAN